MFAGEAAKILGIGVQTLHYYEQQGLIPPPPRSEAGYRLYTPEIIEFVRFIRKAQTLGFSLDEIKELLELTAKGTSPCGRVQATLTEKLYEIDQRLAELHDFRNTLAALITKAPKLSAQEARARVCSIIEKSPALSVSTATKLPLSRRKPKSSTSQSPKSHKE